MMRRVMDCVELEHGNVKIWRVNGAVETANGRASSHLLWLSVTFLPFLLRYRHLSSATCRHPISHSHNPRLMFLLVPSYLDSNNISFHRIANLIYNLPYIYFLTHIHFLYSIIVYYSIHIYDTSNTFTGYPSPNPSFYENIDRRFFLSFSNTKYSKWIDLFLSFSNTKYRS